MGDPYNPVKDASLYPSFHQLLLALQDPGTPNPKSKEQELIFKQVDKLCNNLVKSWLEKKIDNVPKNQTQAKKGLAKIIIHLRKKIHFTQLNAEFHQCKDKDGDVFYLQNDSTHGGFEMVFSHVYNQWCQNQAKSKATRTPGDAIRLCHLMLKENYRSAIHGYLMKTKKDRAKLDQSKDPTKALFDAIKTEFVDPSIVVPVPAGVDASQFGDDADPNSPEVTGRNIEKVEWLIDMFQVYFKPKYKSCLTKWNKETGGGGRTLADFPKYTSGMTWIQWVYAMDEPFDWPLAGAIDKALVPKLRNESSFPGEVGGVSEPVSDVTASSKMSKGEKVVKDIAETKDSIKAMSDCVINYFSTKETATKANFDDPSSITNHTELMEGYHKHKRDHDAILDDEDFSPNTKQKFLKAVKTKKKNFAKRIIELDEEKRDGDD